MTLLIAFAVLSILVSFICSILEAALLSLTPSYIAQQKLERPRLYERLKALKDKIASLMDDLGTAVQVLSEESCMLGTIVLGL